MRRCQRGASGSLGKRSNSIAIGAVVEVTIEDQLGSSTSFGDSSLSNQFSRHTRETINSFESTFRGEFGHQFYLLFHATIDSIFISFHSTLQSSLPSIHSTSDLIYRTSTPPSLHRHSKEGDRSQKQGAGARSRKPRHRRLHPQFDFHAIV